MVIIIINNNETTIAFASSIHIMYEYDNDNFYIIQLGSILRVSARVVRHIMLPVDR